MSTSLPLPITDLNLVDFIWAFWYITYR